jgi:hypothetical protein
MLPKHCWGCMCSACCLQVAQGPPHAACQWRRGHRMLPAFAACQPPASGVGAPGCWTLRAKDCSIHPQTAIQLRLSCGGGVNGVVCRARKWLLGCQQSQVPMREWLPGASRVRFHYSPCTGSRQNRQAQLNLLHTSQPSADWQLLGYH